MDISLYESIARIYTSDINYDIKNPKNPIIDKSSIGSGFFINPNVIVTCSHVVNKSKTIYITVPMLSDIKYKAKIIFFCDKLDIALLETLEYKSKLYLNIDISNNILLQDSVIVIGFPLGSDKQKITKGIVSGMERGLIQIDSAINSGNSGGPLINSNNKVIGIITSKIENASNIGYCIPISYIKIFVRKNKPLDDSIIQYNSCNILADFSNTSTDRILQINKIDINIKSGITVNYLSNSSPLNKINIGVGDVIINFDNYNIDNYGNINLNKDINNIFSKMNLNYYFDRLTYDRFYKIIYYSSKKNKIIKDKIIFEDSNKYGIIKLFPLFDKLNYLYLGGLILSPLTINTVYSKIGKFINNKIDIFKNYVIVVNITPESPFNITENIVIGDIICSINNTKIEYISEIIKYIESTTDEYITILTHNNNIDTISLEKIKENFEYN